MLAACEGQQATQSALGVVPSAQGAIKFTPTVQIIIAKISTFR